MGLEAPIPRTSSVASCSRASPRKTYWYQDFFSFFPFNPVLYVETRSKTDYKAIVITPEQTLAILKSLPSPLHFTLVITCAATALRASEMLALRWSDLLWEEGRIRISKRWANGEDGETKQKAPMATCRYIPCSRASCVHGGADAFRLRWGFCFSIPQGGGPCSPLRVYFRRRSSATGGNESWSAHRGRAEVWTSQLASQPKQLVGEQGESRTQDRSRNPASREDSDHARSVRAGRRR